MFRPVDWLTLGITFIVIWIVYLFTLAPEQTLEDSGELCTGAYYAGIPHPPGYPFWSVYAWLWTVILPFSNVAWRVEVGESFAAAMGCGLLALMVSRGSSMLIEGIDAIKNIPRQWENSICSISGFVAGTLLGLDFFMWSEAVAINRISLFGVPWLIAVLACLMRWMYAPHQRRYLYLGMFLYGLCATIHQSLLLGAMGIEIAIALASPRLGRDVFCGNSLIYLVGLLLMGSVPALSGMSFIEKVLFHIVGLGSLAATVALAVKTKGLLSEWKSGVLMLVAWTAGVCAYFYEPISCMTVPPMQWGYPRTVEGFFHALSRGQYEGITGYNPLEDPGRFFFQMWYIINGLRDSFNWVYVFIGLLPFFMLPKLHKRERSWIIGLTSIYLFLAVLLVLLINVSPEKASQDLNKVFFTATHALFVMMIGYGLTLLAAYTATHYQKIRKWGFVVGAIAAVLAVFSLKEAIGLLYRGPAGEVGFLEIPHYVGLVFHKDQYGLPVFANLILLALPLGLMIAFLIYRQRGPVLVMLVLFCCMPLWSGLSHWYDSEQRNHWFGYWYGHDMFSPPFTDPKTGKLTYNSQLRAGLLQNPANATLVYPEMDRNTVVFGGTDPGRFCPTYSIYCDSFIPTRCKPEQDKEFDRRDCYLITQNALADGTYLQYLRSQYNRSRQFDPPFFSRLLRYVAVVLHVGKPDNVAMRGPDVGAGNSGNTLVEGLAGLLDNTLDKWFANLGARVEKRRRAEGVYPPSEIKIPMPEESQQCFQDYSRDLMRRAQLGQLRPGEPSPDPLTGQLRIGGQVAIMAINGYICKVIFDQNPDNSFYVEESLPIEWMYPYETPFGIIMKINRQPLPELTEDIFKLDHEFWTQYTTRLCGNWITYDTTVREIADFVDRTYVRKNYQGYTGDHAFVRDEDAQKGFCKLRSSQAGMYAWRCALPGSMPPCPEEYRQKSPASQAALIKETDFAFKQAFAFCPYSAETVFRYVNFLVGRAQLEQMSGHGEEAIQHFDDAVLVGETCAKLDPYNSNVTNMVNSIKSYRSRLPARAEAMNEMAAMMAMARTNPANIENLIKLAEASLQVQQTNRATACLDVALERPELTLEQGKNVARGYSHAKDFPKLERALRRLVRMAPHQPEPQYDLAALEAIRGSTNEALADLKAAMDLNAARLAKDPGARDMMNAARNDARFDGLRALPEFKKLVPAF